MDPLIVLEDWMNKDAMEQLLTNVIPQLKSNVEMEDAFIRVGSAMEMTIVEMVDRAK